MPQRYCLWVRFAAGSVAIALTACASITRVEQDIYTHTRTDTTYTTDYRNAPGERGVIYPSNRITQTKRMLEQYDSTVERQYPNFIRLALFESAGLIGTASQGNAVGGGIFGIYLPPEEAFSRNVQPKSAVFSGALYRYGVVEYRLRWFDDAPNWSIGSSAVEIFQLEASNTTAVVGVLPVYLRKRYYLHDRIPYVCLTGAVGLGFLPSQYLHVAASLDAGSLGGANLRAYAGLLLAKNSYVEGAPTITQPYLGLSASLLDFHNHPRELQREWKDHEHSAWDIGLFRFTPFLRLSGDSGRAGFQLQIAPTTIAIPLGPVAAGVGADLFTFVVAFRSDGSSQSSSDVNFGYGVLPLHASVWLPLGDGLLAAEPFALYSYFPHRMLQFGARLHAYWFENITVGVTVGHISSAGFSVSSGAFSDLFSRQVFPAFELTYVGISIGIPERIFRPSELRYYRGMQR